jgi:hypothetical protein
MAAFNDAATVPALTPSASAISLVGEVGVIAEKDRKPLALRQREQRGPQIVARLARIEQLERHERFLSPARSPTVTRHVEHDALEPRFQAPFAPETCSASKRKRKTILHDIERGVPVSEQRRRGEQKRTKTLAVDRLDLRRR